MASQPKQEEVLASSPMAALLEEHGASALPKVGDVVKGAVISVSKNEVHIDVDGITTGVIRGRELFDESGEYANLHMGDIVQATLLELENETNQMELSFRMAGHKKAWTELERLMKDRSMVDATITDANRGGLMVRVGRVVGFLPVSQLSTEHYPRVEGGDKNRILEILQTYINQSFPVKIIDINEADDKLIVSEKAAMEEKQKELISQFEVGSTIDGVVTGVVDFGVFVEFGPKLEGLVHISELAWQRIDDPRDLMKVGDVIQAKIIAIEGTKISLSVKRLTDDPWKKAVERYDVGQLVRGKVLKLNTFGAFVELDSEIHGLAHISELAEKMVRDPADVVTVGRDYTFKILTIDPKNHRLGLSLKAARADNGEKSDETKETTPEEESVTKTTDDVVVDAPEEAPVAEASTDAAPEAAAEKSNETPAQE